MFAAVHLGRKESGLGRSVCLQLCNSGGLCTHLCRSVSYHSCKTKPSFSMGMDECVFGITLVKECDVGRT